MYGKGPSKSEFDFDFGAVVDCFLSVFTEGLVVYFLDHYVAWLDWRQINWVWSLLGGIHGFIYRVISWLTVFAVSSVLKLLDIGFVLYGAPWAFFLM